MKKIILLSGGSSEEREVSLISSKAIFESLKRMDCDVTQYILNGVDEISEFISCLQREKPDVVFIGLHGGWGENGKIQSLLDLMQIKYTGSGAVASATAMDKILSSSIAESIGLDVPRFRIIAPEDKVDDYELPFVIKPADSGSSFGVSIVTEKEDVESAVKEAFKFSDRVMVQEFIDGKEMTVSVLNGEVLPEIEIRPQSGWYDYKNKYTKGCTDYITETLLKNEERMSLKKFAKLIFDYIGCRNYGRIDFRYDGKKFYFLEINTLPGMTELSLTPKAALKAGIGFDDLIKNILKNANFN
ncbi:MAG: D-alanine--D-alanine ligase [Candidatus Cloacimonadota bacterium]|nr:MAG: D-alanine--D-alanine ligase [Candidatus Cloacimonadota bacterium]